MALLPFAPHPPLDPAIAADFRARYEAGAASIASLARECERSAAWLRKHADKAEWLKPAAVSKSAAARKKPAAKTAAAKPKAALPKFVAHSTVKPKADEPAGEADTSDLSSYSIDDLIKSLLRSALRYMRGSEQRIAEGEVGHAEAREITSLVKMAGDLRKALQFGEGESSGAMNDKHAELAPPKDFAADMARAREALAAAIDAAAPTHPAPEDSGSA